MNDSATLLIVDDRPENLLSLEALLADDGVRIVKAASGREALGLSLRHDLALVLLDVQMPEMDGYETAELMRGNPKTRHVPIIFVTAGEKSSVNLFKGYEAGAVDYIYKPVDPVILRSKVRIFAELHRHRRALERQEELLERQVAERTRELKASEERLSLALREAEAANRTKSEFLANMSHEIRTPITGIVGAIDLLRFERLSPTQAECLDIINTSAHNLLSLIEDILDLSKIEAGKLTIERRDFVLRTCLEEAVAVHRERLLAKKLDFSLQIDAAVPERIVGDPLRLKQIVFNLLGNAVKFTQHGKIGVAVREIERREGHSTLQIAVSDTGIGIPPEICARIFKPFEQADGSTTRRYGGTGLGLSICQRLLDMMGGTIGVESRVGEGSTFVLTLPCATVSAATQTAVAREPVAAEEPKGLRVLLAEDNQVNQVIIRKFLERLGHRVILAEDGNEALSLLEAEGPFSLVLMDIMMPIMDGLDALAQIRAREAIAGEHLPVVAITAHAQTGDRERYLAAGFDDYVAKPLRLEDLVSCIRRTRPTQREATQLH